MKKLSILSWVGAVALLAGCDPYQSTNTSPPKVVTAFATIADQGSPVDTVQGTVDPSGTWIIGDTTTAVPAGSSVIFVKYNVLLDGATVQTSIDSCVPASTLTVNGVANPADWFTCYSPGSGTPEEGASVVIYQGVDITPGVGGAGFLSQATMVAGTYNITYTPKDKQGRDAPVSLTVLVQ